MELLKAQGVRRTLGKDEARTQALRGVDLLLKRGKSYAITGPSGCGKSTLLYLLGLLDRPDSGSISIMGRPISDASDTERTQFRNQMLGFVFQFHFLLPEFSAQENVMLPMRRLGRLSRKEMLARSAMLMEQVGLADKMTRSTGHLSGGEQQRVAVARALANEPALVLADEPTGNLDERNSRMVFELLGSAARGTGRSVLIVTHNPELATRCDETLRMRDGLFV
ncbi:MAG: ABC transporter ATP-binding protein [Opitutales bacterium]|nr:ABC transporter ATP-binding protein [Opitutales bacterium]